MGRLHFILTASRHASKNRQVDEAWLPQAGRCGNTSRLLRWPTRKSIAVTKVASYGGANIVERQGGYRDDNDPVGQGFWDPASPRAGIRGPRLPWGVVFVRDAALPF